MYGNKSESSCIHVQGPCSHVQFFGFQVIKARFGSRTHLVFCTFAFFTNLIVMMSLTIAGTAVLNSLVADLSPELAAMLLASVIGGYTLIGGLGATFYVSYFNTALIFVLILMLVVEVFYNPFNNPENPFGSSESVFDFIACWKAPEEEAMGNKGGSYLTFFSSGKLSYPFSLVLVIIKSMNKESNLQTSDFHQHNYSSAMNEFLEMLTALKLLSSSFQEPQNHL